MFKRVFVSILLLALISCSYVKSAVNNNPSTISNGYFSFNIPYEIKDTYNVRKNDNGIYICEKKSEQAGLGGFAFGLKIFKSPKEYAYMPNAKKIGELTDKNGIIYDMVLMRPTDVQYIEEKETEKIYNRLYNYGDKVEIKGINGSKFFKNAGTKGEDLYGEILKKYKKAFTEKWTSDEKFENEDMGYMYYNLLQSNKDLRNEIGYAYYDINSDGIDELFIGKIAKGKSKGIIYDMYTMVERKPTHVLSGGDIDKYIEYLVFNCVFLCNESSLTKNENSMRVFVLEKNSTELFSQITFIYDANKNKKSPWFITYDNVKDSKNVSKKLYNKRKSIFSKRYKRFDFIPIGI